jgi:hypothetical protein
MKKIFSVFFLTFFTLSLATSAFADTRLEDTWMDRTGDWFAVLGKSGSEKEQILFERRTDRATHRAASVMKHGMRDAREAIQRSSGASEKSMKEMSKALNEEMKQW